MAEIYRVEKGSEEWKYKAYDYVRTDAFCCGQNIPIELEFGQDESKDDLQAILLTEDHKPVAGCRIAFPAEKTGKIERVCVVREKQKSGYGRVLIEAAEKWLKEYDVDHIVINDADPVVNAFWRAATEKAESLVAKIKSTPVNMETCEHDLKVTNATASFVLPLGATINMSGNAIYYGLVAIFFAQVYNIDLSMGAWAAIILTSTLGAIGQVDDLAFDDGH